jgi:hypothetical protein
MLEMLPIVTVPAATPGALDGAAHGLVDRVAPAAPVPAAAPGAADRAPPAGPVDPAATAPPSVGPVSTCASSGVGDAAPAATGACAAPR